MLDSCQVTGRLSAASGSETLGEVWGGIPGSTKSSLKVKDAGLIRVLVFLFHLGGKKKNGGSKADRGGGAF